MLKKDKKVNEEIIKFLTDETKRVRKKLKKEKPDRIYRFGYEGLCDRACRELITNLDGVIWHGYKFNVESFHGEQRHTREIWSKYWIYQHTWVVVTVNGEIKFYVDPTSGQFKHLYHDIPDFYVSDKKPRWYYPDDNNPAWRGIGGWLNQKIMLPVCTKELDENTIGNFHVKYKKVWHKDGIIEFIQYEIIGRISDFIRSITSMYEVHKL